MKSDPSLDAGYDSFIISGYHPPGMSPTLPPPAEPVEWVRNSDGTVLMDHRQRPVSVNRLLATKPLRRELSTRPGPCNRKLTYISGDGVTRTLNDIFGHDGWNLDIKQTKREVREKVPFSMPGFLCELIQLGITKGMRQRRQTQVPCGLYGHGPGNSPKIWIVPRGLWRGRCH